MSPPDPAPAIFLDKDGTLLRDAPFNVDPARLEFLPGAFDACRAWRAAGYKLVVVSNQSGLARGLFSPADLGALEAGLRERFQRAGAPLDGCYFCPHHPQGIVAEYAVACRCRKPLPGLLLDAARDLDLDLRRSWMVGDILDDVEAGHRAGCRAALLDTGGETRWLWGRYRTPDFHASDWPALHERWSAREGAERSFHYGEVPADVR